MLKFSRVEDFEAAVPSGWPECRRFCHHLQRDPAVVLPQLRPLRKWWTRRRSDGMRNRCRRQLLASAVVGTKNVRTLNQKKKTIKNKKENSQSLLGI